MNTPATVEIGTLIGHSPGIKRGSAHVAGTSVLVRSIVRWHQAGLMPEEIVAKYGFLRLEQIHAALAYYYANRLEIDSDLARAEVESAGLEEQATRQA
jgi:uncharacterized protein (DUF433 family)